MLLEQVNKEAAGRRVKIILAGAVSGAANAGALAAASEGSKGGSPPGLTQFLIFLLYCVIYVFYFHYSISKVSEAVELYVFKTRTRLMDKLRAAELRDLEQLGTTVVYERITGATTEISQSALALAAALQGAAMLVFTSVYLASKSMAAFLVTLAIYGGGALYERREMERAKQAMGKTASTQGALFDALTDVLKGSKEARFSSARSEALSEDFRALAESLRGATVGTNSIMFRIYVLGSVNLFVLLGVVMFILPQYISEYSDLLSELTVGVIFIVQPIGMLTAVIPQYVKADLVAQTLSDFEEQLDRASGEPPALIHDPWGRNFRELRLEDVSFGYAGADARNKFSIGPLSLKVKAGEILFIVGGNGSGKSTLVKVLTALYAPSSGSLHVNDVRLTPSNVQAYREMIAGVLSDFHLFKKLYGLSKVGAEEIDRLLEKFDLKYKLRLENRAWSDLDLSTGQRKRLAMAVALLEERPIHVFDEWAADQDPSFRHYYYEELLPELKRQGKTVIAISHDDRYFHCADRVITLEYGQIRSVTDSASESQP